MSTKMHSTSNILALVKPTGDATINPTPRYKGDSSGGGGGNMEARIAKLEATTEHIQSDATEIKLDARESSKESRKSIEGIRSDMRIDFKWTIGGFIMLLGAMTGGFKMLYTAIEALPK